MDERIPFLDLLLRRERAVTAAGLAVITGLSWLWLIAMATDMAPPGKAMPGMDMGAMLAAGPASWTALDFGLTVVMWAVMMVAMMLPSAAPMILIYGLARRRQQDKGRGGEYASNGAFAAGYLFAWAAFSIAATALQWGLEQAALLSPMMVSASPWLGGGLLIGAGLYQFTPLKQACLVRCRAPFEFLSRHWRPGAGGAFAMGLHHGVYCLGCCWVLMALLFVLGVMNLAWVGALAGFVLLEKLVPRGALLGRAAGVALIAWGIAVLLAG
jgi:predicted metal-binding membrane protein